MATARQSVRCRLLMSTRQLRGLLSVPVRVKITVAAS
jgi:hypothetical protein